MFYLSSLVRELSIDPKDITSDIKGLISSRIRDLEGVIIGDYGYVVSIVEFNQSSKGKIDNETGKITYKVNYKAITFKPEKNELMITTPVVINDHGFFCKVGHLQLFISKHTMDGWKYNMGSSWKSSDGKSVSLNSPIVVRIIASRINSNEITALAELVDVL